VIKITEIAHEKSRAIVNAYPEEIAWFGLTTKEGNDYIIHDIFVPRGQKTAAANVKTTPNDMAEAMQWASEQRDVHNAYIGAHFHSHVSMTVSPSVTDINQLAETLKDGAETYVHFIYNKKNEYSCMLGHLGYIFKEVKVEIIGRQNFAKWAEEEVKMIKENNKSTIPTYYGRDYQYADHYTNNYGTANNSSFVKKSETVLKQEKEADEYAEETFYGHYKSIGN